MDGADDTVANFLVITGATEAQALQMLEATGYQLQDAVELFFAAGPDQVGNATTTAAAGTNRGADPIPIEDDEALARRLAAGPSPGQEEEVRAPIPTRRERLYGEDVIFHRERRRVENPVPANVVDAFRDFKAEAGEGPGAGGSGNAGLASLFEPPRHLLFKGGAFEDAKQFAAQRGHWLILNLQSTSQFASHQLNRDMWNNPMVGDLVEHNFVLYQVYDQVEEAQKLISFYHVFELPAILVIDPVTGAPMKHWTGFISAERFLEELLPFLDTTFSDPGAARLAASLKRKKTLPGAGGATNSSREGSDNELAGPGSSGGGVGGFGGVFPGNDDDDAELMAAIQASMKEQQQQQQQQQQPIDNTSNGGGEQQLNGGKAGAEMEEDEEQQKQHSREVNVEEVLAQAQARLPDEAAAAGPEGCRIGMRFPDGSRGQRRFPRSAPLSSVRYWCLIQQAEAASGRPFALCESIPGAPEVGEDKYGASLQDLGLADSMLVMKWTD